MRLQKSIKNILTGLYLSVKRFPATILFSISVAALLIAIHELNPAEDTLKKAAMACALGMPLSLSIRCFFERKNEANTFGTAIGYAAGVIVLILYYFFFMKDMGMVTITRYIAVTLALYLAFLFTPYFPGRSEFEMYIITIVTGFFITIIYSLVLYAGLSAILFAIDKLLGIAVLSKVYYYTWLFVVFIFGVSYFLSGIPQINREMNPKNYPKLLRILLLYIVMPLLAVYTSILYIYFGKIVTTTQWPVGMVSHLVLWYSLVVTVTLFFITPLLPENRWAYRFSKFAPAILLPLLLMMFISIGIRIKAYGVTEPRCYVVVLAVWVFCIMLYFTIKKNLRNIVIPVSLALVALLTVFGPLSSYSISKYSQNKRFEKILVKNNMLKEGNIQSSSDISREDKAHISSILDYFSKNHSLNAVKYLPKGFKIEEMNKVFGFSYEEPAIEGPDGFFYYTRSPEEKALDVRGYDYLIDTRSLMEGRSTAGKGLDAVYDYERSYIKISYEGKEFYAKDLDVFAQGIIEKQGVQRREAALSTDEMTIIDENDKIKVKIIFQSISGNRSKSNESIKADGYEFYIMVKLK